MKIKHVLPFLIALCMLAGCTEQDVSDISEGGAAEEASVTTADAVISAGPAEVTTSAAATAIPEEPEDLVMECLETVEVYEDITLSDFVTKTNVELADGSALLDTSDIGLHEAEIAYIYEGNEFTQTVEYSVVDNTPPVLLGGIWNLNLLTGSELDLEGYVSYADNYDRAPSLGYSGKIDTYSPGTYIIAATIEDSSGNTYTWDITVNVADEFPSSGGSSDSTTSKTDFSDFTASHGGDNVRFGIDVSKWQGDIDFDAVRDAGCSFVVIRIGSYYDEIIEDSCFRQNLENASAAGLDVGVYYYSTDRDIDVVKDNAKWIADQLDGFELELPVVFDWEDFGHFQDYGMSIHDLNEIYAVFADEMEGYGYSAMLYGSKNYLNNFWSEKTKSSHPVWLAHYTDETDYEGEFAMWQASASGRIPGIYGDVDMDIQYMDKPID